MTPYLVEDLKIEEGFKAEAYPDPRSHGPPWTIGYGHTGREVHPGLVWDQSAAATALAGDVAATARELDTAIPWWRQLDDTRQDVLVDMAFNLGVHGLMGFTTFLGFVHASKFAEAALDLRGTAWFYEVGERGRRLQQQMASGNHVAPT